MQTIQVEAEVERIAGRLGRGLSLEDLDGALLAYSTHQSPADRVRVNFLLSKKVPEDVGAWQRRHGITTAVSPVAVPPNPELGMLGRVCVPLLVRGFRVGYLWVQQDADEETPEHILRQLSEVREDTDRLAALLLEGNTAGSEHRTRREATFHACLEGDPDALEDLTGWPELDGTSPWQLAVLRDDAAGSSRTAADAPGEALARRAAGLQATVGADAVVFSAGAAAHSVLLLRADAREPELSLIRRRYLHYLGAAAGVGELELFSGTSEPCAAAEGLPGAYLQARAAVQAASVDPQLGSAVEYRSIGIYQFLASGGRPVSARSVYFDELRNHDRNAELLPVLELLYDKNGSVQEVADQLHLHRSSVYNRLARVRSVIGVDPLRGPVRLELHCALKALRWSGRPRI